MAKKARKKGEEEEAFEFPEFDERAFLRHEFGQFYATMLAFAFGVIDGAAAWAVGDASQSVLVAFGAGVALVVGAAYAIRRIRADATDYTRGDWASLIALMFFSFLGIWFLLADLL